MLGAPCSPCCTCSSCRPSSIFVEVAPAEATGMIVDGSGGAQFPGNLNMGNASASSFSWGGGTFSGDVSAESGLAFICPDGYCMRISPDRLTQFQNDVRATYELTASVCDSVAWEYRNNSGECVGNSIRRLRFEIGNAGGRYPITSQLTGVGNCMGPVTIANRGKPEWLQYFMSADICIVGDRGNSAAQGCTVPGNVAFCNCFPTTYTKSAISGPCTYSGSCATTITMHSFGGAFFLSGGGIADQDDSAFVPWWPDESIVFPAFDSTITQTDPRCTTNRFCAAGDIQSATARNGLSTYGTRGQAICYNVPNDIYFPLFSASGVLNNYPGCSSSLAYHHRDILGLIVKALKRV
jgi:hypothetical protein